MEKKIKKRERERLGRICVRCGKRFVPTGRYSKLCDNCQGKSNREKYKKMKEINKK